MIRPVVFSNCIHSMLAILRAMYQLQIEYSDPERVVGVLIPVHTFERATRLDLAATLSSPPLVTFDY